ncbi:MAG TPA: NAD(P)-binding protein [Nitrospiria bacterium]
MLNSSRRYDAIVIGAGLEGLLCAALLSKRGKGVVVLEESATAGGVPHRVVRNGYTFLRGPDLFLGFERDGLYDRIFSELGLSLAILKREALLFHKTHPPLQIILPDHRLDYFTDTSELLNELKREFPDQIQELRSFWMEMESLEAVIRPRMHQAQRARPATVRDWMTEIRGRFRYWSTVRTQQGSLAKEFLSRHRIDPKIQRGLELLLLIFIGKNMDEATALDLVHLLGLVQREMIAISGGIPTLAGMLEKVILDNQGEVIYGRPAAELLLRKRRLDGVRLEDGEAIHASSILLNLPWHPDEERNSERREFSLYYGIAENMLPTPMKNHVLFMPSYIEPSLNDNFLYLRLNSPGDAWAAPQGRRSLQVTGFLPESDRPRREATQALIKSVTEHLLWLIPFADGALTYLGDDLGETETAARIPLKLAEQVQITRRVDRDGARYYRSSLKNLYLMPDLGRRPVASQESPRTALELADLLSGNA